MNRYRKQTKNKAIPINNSIKPRIMDNKNNDGFVIRNGLRKIKAIPENKKQYLGMFVTIKTPHPCGQLGPIFKNTG